MRPEDELFPHLVDGARIEVADGTRSQQPVATMPQVLIGRSVRKRDGHASRRRADGGTRTRGPAFDPT
jgi:hypothetical protein